MSCSTSITGGNAGVGFEAARAFAADQSRMVVAARRDLAIGKHTVEQFKAMGGNAASRAVQMLESAKAI
jgi:NAD(P)-dependent dehydrogenase (short-subunit alcohol dehydrogenase family)